MKKIAVFTSGGDAPGMNACIRAVVRTSVRFEIEVVGIKRGYDGMISNDFVYLNSTDVANIIQKGGTILKTARCEEFRTPEGRQKAYKNLQQAGIEGLICIGGNGTYAGALELYREYGIPAIGAPGTIDNDLYGTDFTIGFDTAVNTAVEAIDKIRDTADAHNRVFIVEVMGRDSGFIGLYTGLAAGAEAILIPEEKDDYDNLIRHFQNKNRRHKQFSIIIVAEGETDGNAIEIMKKMAVQFPELDIRASVLGHIQRGGNPSAADRILASQLGYSAVKALRDGEHGKCVGVVNSNVVLTPFELAIQNANKINPSLRELTKILSY